MLRTFIVTHDNLDQIKDQMMALDQIEEVKPGCLVYQFEIEGGQAGQITAWPKAGRAGICFGGDSEWGEWSNETKTLMLDEPDDDGEPICYDHDGERIPYEKTY